MHTYRSVTIASAAILGVLLQAPTHANPDTKSDSVKGNAVNSTDIHHNTDATGNVTKLEAKAADDSTLPGASPVVLTQPPPIMPYNGGPYSVGPAALQGFLYFPTATAAVTLDTTTAGLRSWDTRNSIADLQKGKGKHPNYQGSEDAEARAEITDPWSINGVHDNDLVTFSLDINPGAQLSIDPHPAVGEVVSASDAGFAETSLNNLGVLWQWSWTADSLTQGTSQFLFSSNPALGLDDAAVMSSFNSLVSYDGSTGEYNLSAPFSISKDVFAAPGTTDYTFGGDEVLDVAGSVAATPEGASPFTLLVCGSLGMGACLFRKPGLRLRSFLTSVRRHRAGADGVKG